MSFSGLWVFNKIRRLNAYFGVKINDNKTYIENRLYVEVNLINYSEFRNDPQSIRQAYNVISRKCGKKLSIYRN